jgi:sigma-54 dependent transcriptional regulator, acetoin dehydrogenase operon transcriptional activator AcoR
MKGPLTPATSIPDGERVATTRERFLTAEPIEPNLVREAILASWWRSRAWNVDADNIELAYIRDPDLDTALSRSAMPVLRKLLEHLDGQPISVILTDPTGLVLTRLSADNELDRHLDRVHLAPGFSYAEEHVGTNGIGTALEGGQPMVVFGHEHYAEHLEDLACAGVPIHHPITGKTVGAVDLTCWRKDADPLLIALAKSAADQIRQAMLTDGSVREFELLQEYMRACGRTSGIVLAINDDVVMMNDYARKVLDASDQPVLLRHASEALARHDTEPRLVELPTGVQARMSCRPVRGQGWLAGGVIQAKLTEHGRRRPSEASLPTRTFLPGLVGSGPLWVRACQEVDTALSSGEWLAIQGERGVGKLSVIRAVYQRRNPAGRFRVLDCADAAEPEWMAGAFRELTDGHGALVLRHVDLLSGRRMQAMASALQAVRAAHPMTTLWVVVTLSSAPEDGPLAELIQSFPSTVELPPLRHHVEDVHDLVPYFLSKLNPEGRLTCSPEAITMLLRSSWPGNTEQLRQVVKRVCQKRRSGTILPADLPPECRTVSRRLLSPLEAIERDAIVQALLDCNGSKAKAAESLGMSRATIYRKVHEYGIVVTTS